MNSKDSISDGFKELLGGINKELDTRLEEIRKSNGIKSTDSNTQKTSEPAHRIQNNATSSDSNGTRVFDTVKTDVASKNKQNISPDKNSATEKKQSLTTAAEKNIVKSTPACEVANIGGKNIINNNQPRQNSMPKSNVPTNKITQKARPVTSDTTQFSAINNTTRHNHSNNHLKEQENTLQDKKTKKNLNKKKSGILSGVVKLILYISLIVVVSVLLARYIIGVGNDMFSFVKDTYSFSDTVYLVKGDSDNTLKITDTKLSGNKFTFNYKFNRALTETEKSSLDATITLIDTKDNSIAHNYGKFGNVILQGDEITIDLSESKMQDGDYVLRFTVTTSPDVSFITEFTLSKKIVNIVIPDGATTGDIAQLLNENGIIDHPFAFRVYTNYKKDKSSSYLGKEYIAGEHTLHAGMDYDTIIYALSPKLTGRTIVRLTFPEGSTVDEIIDILIKGGVENTREEYVDVINNYEFDYDFVKLLDSQEFPKERKYRLEGYLFPDTYEFYSDASPAAVIDKFLSNFNVKFDHSYYDEATKLGLTVDEVITLASIIEKEARMPDDFGLVSSVFHNRLNRPSEFPYLQSDATVQYIFPERKGKITPEDLEIISPYNTYKSKGLPPSAIANPGLEAIIWALYPAEPRVLDSAGNPTGSRIYYYYFIAKSDGSNLYARNLSEHQANIEKVRREKAN